MDEGRDDGCCVGILEGRDEGVDEGRDDGCCVGILEG